jgi:hypothetical protein
MTTAAVEGAHEGANWFPLIFSYRGLGKKRDIRVYR